MQLGGLFVLHRLVAQFRTPSLLISDGFKAWLAGCEEAFVLASAVYLYCKWDVRPRGHEAGPSRPKGNELQHSEPEIAKRSLTRRDDLRVESLAVPGWDC